jgi:hypothetical protein
MNLNTLAGRKLLSLDQCLLSQLAIQAKRDADFENLLQALLSAVRDKRIVCLAHELETKYESIKCENLTHARKVVDLQNKLSLGYAFQNFWDIVASKMLEMVRPSFHSPAYRHKQIRLGCYAELGLKRARLKVMDNRCEEVIGQFPCPPKRDTKGTPFADILADIEGEREDSMRRVLRSISANPRIAPRLGGVVDWTLGVGKSLVQAHVTPDECHALLRAVEDGGWRRLDVLRAHATLFAKIEQQTNRRWRLSDHADIYRLSVALFHADVATCDKSMRDLLKQTKLDNAHRAKVLDVTQPLELTAYVQSVVTAAAGENTSK